MPISPGNNYNRHAYLSLGQKWCHFPDRPTPRSADAGGSDMSFGLESISVESSKTSLTDNRDGLMLSTATESLETRPERLRVKSQKFYDIIPSTTITARQQALDAMNADPVSIKELLQWLDKIWLDGDLKEFMTEEEYLEFRKAIEEFWILNTQT